MSGKRKPFQGRSMFSRIMGMVLVVIVLLAAMLSGLCWMTLRNQQINARLDALKKEARDIAYLAAQSDLGVSYLLGREAAVTRMLNRKAEEVYRDYGAYIAVVNRSGQVMDNLAATYDADPGFVDSLNFKEIRDALIKVVSGEEISVRTTVDGAPTFTVGVPFTQNNMVLGAVFIQTKAQVIEGGTAVLIAQVAAAAALATVLGAVSASVFVHTVMKPLGELTGAARAMAEGDFTVRVNTEEAPGEIAALSSAFNTMSEKLSALETSRREFVANVSHELRSPITAISGFVQGMEDGTIPAEEHPKYLALVGDETRRLSKLIGDLLALSRLERDDATLDWSDFDLNEMLRRAIIRRVNDLEARRMEVVCDFRAEPCMVRADSDRIEQVVVNLLDNAVKFTPEGGRITLTTRTDGDTCLATVADNGVGVLPEDRPRVFERFFTADRAHTAGKGTGLGLSICQRILEMHGQTIRLEDTDEGAAFAFTLARGKKQEARLPGGGLPDGTEDKKGGEPHEGAACVARGAGRGGSDAGSGV